MFHFSKKNNKPYKTFRSNRKCGKISTGNRIFSQKKSLKKLLVKKALAVAITINSPGGSQLIR